MEGIRSDEHIRVPTLTGPRDPLSPSSWVTSVRSKSDPPAEDAEATTHADRENGSCSGLPFQA